MSETLRIASWNCHYGLDEVKAKCICERWRDTDIFVIQECKRTDIGAFQTAWKFKNWYGDDQEFSDLGIAVFSNTCKIEFTDEFCRQFRYVVPYKVTKGGKSLDLFAVWTKPVPLFYDKNVSGAIKAPEYQKIVNGDLIIIGDFNTGSSEENKYYQKLLENLNGFKDCNTDLKKKSFYSVQTKKEYLNDFCFVSESLFTKAKKITTVIDDKWDVNQYGQKRWCGSDHCPIIVDFELA